MRSGAAIWAADFALCLRELGPFEGDEQAQVLAALGLDLLADEAVDTGLTDTGIDEKPVQDGEAERALPPPPGRQGAPTRHGRSVLDPLPTEPADEQRALERFGQPLDVSGRIPRRPDPDPLIRPTGSRGAVISLATVLRPVGDPDVDRVVDAISRFEPLHRVPRLPEPTLARPLELWFDTGEGMAPFRHDVADVVEHFEQVFGGVFVIREFEGCPSRGLWSDCPGAPSDATVVVLTDLGCAPTRWAADRVTAAEWADWAKSLGRRGNRAVALVPFPSSYWPDLPRNLSAIYWSRRTTAAHITARTRRR